MGGYFYILNRFCLLALSFVEKAIVTKIVGAIGIIGHDVL